MAAKPITPLLLDRKNTARALSISIRTVDYLVQTGKLRHRRIGSRVLIPTSQVKQLAETGVTHRVAKRKGKDGKGS